MARTDSFSAFDDLLADLIPEDPWIHEAGDEPHYAPDYDAFEQLLEIPIKAGKASATGALANAVDSWLSYELRRAGFGLDEVWPRPVRPRILPRDVAVLLERLPLALAQEVRARVESMPSVAPSDAHFLGRAYEKQVDVAIARWDRGPELLLSTKTQVSSFGKNLPNRFEEAYGDAGNLRGRYPLAAVGFFFVQRATIVDSEPSAFERTVDMMRKLRDVGGNNGYTATGLALVSWEDGDSARPTIELDRVPEDIRPAQFMTRMVSQVLAATPVNQHVLPRELIERRSLPVIEEDEVLAE
ncbi:hypothetical protein ACFRFH_04470 [Leifsonia sp. NPDC056824]|uniref:hypothetical protein n=1 Tax=Leifsonia sp. NPDC056824 TaxID=3345953 RepID=UPI00369C5234